MTATRRSSSSSTDTGAVVEKAATLVVRWPRRAAYTLGAAALVLLGVGIVVLFGVVTASPSLGAPSNLSVEDLVLSPALSTSPATVLVRGRVRNVSDVPAHQVSIGLSAADPGQGNHWTPLQLEPRGTIAVLQPNAAVPFYGAMRLEGNGRFAVGVIALSDESVLPPQLRPVWLLAPRDFATEVTSVFAAYAFLLGLVALALYLATRAAPGRGHGLEVRRRELGAATAVAIAGPVLIWTLRAVLIRSLGPGAPSWIWAELPWIGSMVFAAGWLLGGSALRPRGSRIRGVALAAVLYVLCGLVWTVALQVSFGRTIPSVLADADVMLFSLQWPLQIAQVTGLFGLSY